MKATRGFTLKELLVVMGIIMILASIVLVSFPRSKNTANDAGLKANLANIQLQGVQYYNVNNGYGVANTGSTASCTLSGTIFNDPATTIDDPIGVTITAAMRNASGNIVLCRSTTPLPPFTSTSYPGFLVAGKLSNGNYWCIDSVGHAKEETAAPLDTATACL